MNDLNELITSHTMRSFNAGRKYEFDKMEPIKQVADEVQDD